MRTFETKSWRWEVTDRELRLLQIRPVKTGGYGDEPNAVDVANLVRQDESGDFGWAIVAAIDKREFAEALCGLGIVHSAVVRHAEDKPVEVKS